MNSVTKTLLGILAVIGSLFIVVGTLGGRQSEVVLIEIALGSVLKYLAILITVTSVILLLGTALKTKSVGETLPLTIPAAFGLLILAPHWSLGIYLSVLSIAYFASAIMDGKKVPATRDS